MLFAEKVKISNEVSELIKKHGRNHSSLLLILKEYHNNHKKIPEFAKQEITRLLNINPYELNEVISFNKFLRNKPEAKNIVMLDRKSTRLNSSHTDISRMPSSA